MDIIAGVKGQNIIEGRRLMITNQDSRKYSLHSRLVASIVLIVICCCTLVASAKSGYTVDVIADGKTITVSTSQDDVDVILDQAGIKLGKKDKINTDSFVVGNDAKDGNKIYVFRSTKVTIVDDGEEISVVAAGTVKDALNAAKIKVRPVDKINYKQNAFLEDGMQIEIKRAFSIDVQADGKKETVEFIEGTVADVLESLEITLGEDDEVSPSLSTSLKPGDSVEVLRVKYEERTATETIKYKTITNNSSSLYRGTTQVERDGKNGKRSVTYKDKFVNGKLSKSTELSHEILEEPVDKIVVKGTKIKVLSTTSPISSLSLPYTLSDGIPTSSITTITGRSTAYTSKAGAGTASGVAARTGYVAVNPRQIPYGTEMYVVSTDGRYVYGYCIAADTGGFARRGSAVIDLYMDTRDECFQWGNREVCIYILKWGNGTVN